MADIFGTENDDANLFSPSTRPDTLHGLGGDDYLWSGQTLGEFVPRSEEGPDTLIGGTGDDRYGVGFTTVWQPGGNGSQFAAGFLPDTVVELPGEGIDTVEIITYPVPFEPATSGPRFTYVMPDNVENLFRISPFVDGTDPHQSVPPPGTFGARLVGNDLDNRIGGFLVAELLEGGNGNDVLTGGAGNDRLEGGAGDDRLSGELDDDVLLGGDGADFLSGDAGNDALSGGEDRDELRAGVGDDRLSGEAGDDLLAAGEGADTLDGGAGNDSLDGEAGGDTLEGGAGDDALEGGAGDDMLAGGAGDDTLHGGAGDDLLVGGAGSDTYSWSGQGEGADVLRNSLVFAEGDSLALAYAAAGMEPDAAIARDVLVLPQTLSRESLTLARAGAHLVLGMAGGTDHVTLEGFFAGNDITHRFSVDAIEFADRRVLSDREIRQAVLAGTAGADVVLALGSSDAIATGAGDDTLDGGGGDDVLDGGAGNDAYLFGRGDGSDIVRNSLVAGQVAGDYTPDAMLFDTAATVDVLRFKAGIAASDLVITREGVHLVLALAGTTDRVTVEGFFAGEGPTRLWSVDAILFADGSELTDAQIAQALPADPVPENPEPAIDPNAGTPANDVLQGGAGDDTLAGLGGNDTLFGETGNDHLDGGEGDDLLIAGFGDDVLSGGDGVDLLGGGPGADQVFGDAGADTLFGDDGDDLVVGGPGNDVVSGGPGNDTLVGDDGDDFLDANEGVDQLFGLAGNDRMVAGGDHDVLAGGDGNDEMAGGGDDDELYGDAGHDQLYGDPGNDLLVGASGNDNLSGGPGDDVLGGGEGDDLLVADEGADRLFGEGGNDRLLGRLGDDLMAAGDGDDQLAGGDGNDTMLGEAGNDLFFGEGGDDLLDGGSGRDTFVFQGAFGHDRIADFHSGEDQVALIGGPFASFAALQGAARQVGADTVITVDADDSIVLAGVQLTALNAGDFLLL